MRVDGSAVRTGMVIEFQDKLWVVIKHEIRTPGNLRAFNQIEMKDIRTGIKTNTRLSSSDAVERVQLDERTYQMLFADGDTYTFMDNESFEQITVTKEQIGAEQSKFLTEGMNVTIQSYEGNPISVTLPQTVVMEITETEPVMKGQTAASSYKPAILSNGVRVMVPPFVGTGEKIVVNTEELTYVERYKAA